MTDIPKWAFDKAFELSRARGHTDIPCCAIDAFARYVAEHEDPPVDPDVAAVRRILSAAKASKTRPTNVEFFASGGADETPYFQAALAAYREVRNG